MSMLAKWVLDEYDNNKSIFGIPEELFYKPENKKIVLDKYGTLLETPIGVAAGPHTQMAQNIVVAWLCGARFIEIKTIQTLDELNVTKPCIDAEDEGYNCEWSQELRLEQSFNEYLKAWILIHLLRDKFGWSESLGTLFNMSVGYNLEGILKPNVQDFLAKMKDASSYKNKYVHEIAEFYPKINEIQIPECLSDNITLSTMHGCPPDEIEKIGKYLIEQGYHTTIKFNPTLLGPELRTILNDNLGYEIHVPDIAFEHDPTFDAVTSIITNLKKISEEKGLVFGVKTTNTLESKNIRHVLPKKEEMHYMSGRALHPITVNVARKLSNHFYGDLNISFSGGADVFNLSDLLSCNIRPITVCTDILKPGGYTRLKQYLESIIEKMNTVKANDIDDFICKMAFVDSVAFDYLKSRFPDFKDWDKLKPENLNNQHVNEIITDENTFTQIMQACGLFSLRKYADKVRTDKKYSKEAFEGRGIKTDEELKLFDCIKAPCTCACATSQDIPGYMYWTAMGDYEKAMEVILRDNALPNTLGRVCDHLCTMQCVRTHYEQPLAIRELKRFITEHNIDIKPKIKSSNNIKVAIIGAGPSGLASSYFLRLEGFDVSIFEARAEPGGMVNTTIPSFRLPPQINKKDYKRLENLGVKFFFNQKIGKDITFSDLKNKGFKYIYIAVGAQKGKALGLQNEDAEGIFDGLEFLEKVKQKESIKLGKKIAIIGGGNSAMDAARTAWRVAKTSEVFVIYRRTKDQMPADKQEIDELLLEGIKIKELMDPKRVIIENGKVTGLECIKMELGEKDLSGRPKPIPIEGSEEIIPLDNVIISIGQDVVLDFLEGTDIVLERSGRPKVDPETFRTSIENVYAGGDAVRGPSSVVRAVGDGKKVAQSIILKETGFPRKRSHEIKTDRIDMLARKSQKIQKDKTFDHFGIDRVIFRDFTEVEDSIPENIAQKEADRCLLCSDMCSICETVCPNKANLTYQIEPFNLEINNLVNKKGKLNPIDKILFQVTQPFQIINIVDFCNECGNCQTFCPTSGAPYKDKPKFFLKEKDFNNYEVTYECKTYIFERTDDGFKIKARIDNKIHELLLNNTTGSINYQNSVFSADIQIKDFSIKSAELLKNAKVEENTRFSLTECAEMYTLGNGIFESMPYFPNVEKEV